MGSPTIGVLMSKAKCQFWGCGQATSLGEGFVSEGWLRERCGSEDE